MYLLRAASILSVFVLESEASFSPTTPRPDVFKFSLLDQTEISFSTDDIKEVPRLEHFQDDSLSDTLPMVQSVFASSSNLSATLLSPQNIEVFQDVTSLRFGNAFYDKRSAGRVTDGNQCLLIDDALQNVEHVVRYNVLLNQQLLKTALWNRDPVDWKMLDVVVGNYVYRDGNSVGQLHKDEDERMKFFRDTMELEQEQESYEHFNQLDGQYTFDRSNRIQNWLQKWKVHPHRFHAHCFNLWVLIDDPDTVSPLVFAKIINPERFKMTVADDDCPNVLGVEEIEALKASGNAKIRDYLNGSLRENAVHRTSTSERLLGEGEIQMYSNYQTMQRGDAYLWSTWGPKAVLHAGTKRVCEGDVRPRQSMEFRVFVLFEKIGDIG